MDILFVLNVLQCCTIILESDAPYAVNKLPLNFNILYEIVERDSILRDINFEDEQCVDCLFCEKHEQRVQHFYCSNHLTVFCRECIKEDHTDERCFVVDLYEIEKMRKMHR